MVHNDKIILKSNISIVLIIVIVMSFLSTSLFIGAIIGSIGIGLLIMSIIYFYLLTNSDKYTLIAAKFWEDKIEIFYPLHINDRRIVLSYPDLEYLFFRSTYMGRSIILIYNDSKSKRRETVIECDLPFLIKKLINHALKCGVKSGMDVNSYAYANLESSIPIIRIDKYTHGIIFKKSELFRHSKKIYSFNSNIEKIIVFTDKVITLLEFNNLYETQNVVCVDLNGQVIWAVEKPFEIIKSNYFTSICLKGGELYAYNIDGVLYHLDKFNGKIIDSQLVK
jgi:hypothetical protein